MDRRLLHRQCLGGGQGSLQVLRQGQVPELLHGAQGLDPCDMWVTMIEMLLVIITVKDISHCKNIIYCVVFSKTIICFIKIMSYFTSTSFLCSSLNIIPFVIPRWSCLHFCLQRCQVFLSRNVKLSCHGSIIVSDKHHQCRISLSVLSFR